MLLPFRSVPVLAFLLMGAKRPREVSRTKLPFTMCRRMWKGRTLRIWLTVSSFTPVAFAISLDIVLVPKQRGLVVVFWSDFAFMWVSYPFGFGN